MKFYGRSIVIILICLVGSAVAFGVAAEELADTVAVHTTDSLYAAPDSLVAALIPLETDTVAADTLAVGVEPVRVFNPNPTRATWLSVLCPGLGQIYNRRYWKLPIVVGAYMGLAYATSWNSTMLTDYTKAYNDLMDNDPDTRSYMNFFSPNVREEDLDANWLQNIFQSRKNYFRRNRDLCIVGMIGVYLLAIVDAYVDASLAHFDISPDLSLNWAPILIQESRSPIPSFGVQWALCF